MSVTFTSTSDNFGIIAIDAAVCDREFITAFEQAVQAAVASSVEAIIITTTDDDLPAAFDPELLLSDAMFACSARFTRSLRTLEMCNRPLVAALPGKAQGAGLEIALAAHARVALQHATIGFPEIALGLLPAHGAMQRLARMLGIEQALTQLSSGKVLTAKDANLCAAIVATRAELLPRARTLASTLRGDARQPWDRSDFCWPQVAPNDFALTKMWMATPSVIFKKTGGHYPVYETIAICIYEGVQLDMDSALANDQQHWRRLLRKAATRNIIKVQAITRPKLLQQARAKPTQEVQTVGIVGTGMMGAGIALVSARAGCRVQVLDRNAELAAAAIRRAESYLQRQQQQQKISTTQAKAMLARISSTTDHKTFADCDLVIEAVYEDRKVKQEIIARIAPLLRDDAVFASNTSTLPITSLAAYSTRPQNFIGLHFFSPVEKMQLVEIIKGAETAQPVIDLCFAYVAKLAKVPILVNDARSFYTSRVFMTYLCEGMALLREGQPAVSIEHAGRKAGMPVAPLALTDEISLSLVQQIFMQAQRDGAPVPAAAQEVIDLMLEKHDRSGRKSGRGFYDYHEKGKQLWPQLHKLFTAAAQPLSLEKMARRLLDVQADEAARCLDEGVVQNADDANIGSILGWGFPLAYGGVLQYREDHR